MNKPIETEDLKDHIKFLEREVMRLEDKVHQTRCVARVYGSGCIARDLEISELRGIVQCDRPEHDWPRRWDTPEKWDTPEEKE